MSLRASHQRRPLNVLERPQLVRKWHDASSLGRLMSLTLFSTNASATAQRETAWVTVLASTSSPLPVDCFKQFVALDNFKLTTNTSNGSAVRTSGKSLLLKREECMQFFGTTLLMVLKLSWLRRRSCRRRLHKESLPSSTKSNEGRRR